MKIMDRSWRLPIDVRRMAPPEEFRNIYGDGNWGGDTYYADYQGLAAHVRPLKILEMGIFLGWSACAIVKGAERGLDDGSQRIIWVGLDNEQERPGSNIEAIRNIRSLDPLGKWLTLDVHKADLMAMPADPGLAPLLDQGPFDLINVDAVHSYDGTLRQMQIAWPMLAPGGVMVVDDANNALVMGGCSAWLQMTTKDPAVNLHVQRYDNPRGWFLVRKEQ